MVTMFPLLSLASFQLESALARRLPKRLAYYHLALPIAEDEDGITVAMAAPDHHMVVKTLETVLGMPVVPVRAHPQEIHQLLNQVWLQEAEGSQSGVLSWTLEPTDAHALSDYARTVAQIFDISHLNENASFMAFSDLMEGLLEFQPKLLVTNVRDTEMLSHILKRTSTSLLLLPDKPEPPRRILHILRGNTPDRLALNWVVPIAQASDATVTLFTAGGLSASASTMDNPLDNTLLRLLLGASSLPLAEYGQVLNSMNIPGRIRVKQGTLENTVMDEISETPSYDLIAIAAESYGAFALRICERVGQLAAVLIIKP